MIKVFNKSKRIVNIENITIKPLEYFIFDEYISESKINIIKSLERLNLIKVYNVEYSNTESEIIKEEVVSEDKPKTTKNKRKNKE